MNLHLAPDQKFLDMVIHNQKLYAPKTRNKYAIFLPKGQVAPVHTKSAEVIAIPHSERKNIESFLGDLSAFQTIYLHSIIPEYYSVVKKQPNLKYAWVLMGSEVFRASIFESYVYEPITEQIFIQYIKNKVRLSANPISFLKSIYRVFNQGLQEKKMSFIMKKCCYFCHFNPMDLEIIRERVNLNTKFIMYSCMTALQLDVSDKIEIRSDVSINILLGNSADPANNHLEVIDLLSMYSNKAFDKVYVPLSYSDRRDYRNIVEDKSKEKLGKRFIPIFDFMPTDQYYSMISNCSIAIFNHVRTQAAINVLVMLLNGCKVYMNEKSSLYLLLKQLGVQLFSVQQDLQVHLSRVEKEGYLELDDKTKLQNKKAIYDYFGESHAQIFYKEFLNL